jgi:hypothetical protein
VSLVRIIIATTASPVTVQRITEEDPDLNSVVCLAGKAMSLPISPAYDAFVRNPTGVIQRHFGHPAFRVDVSEKIDEGYSWQLGLFTAHALHHINRLAQQSDACDHTLILTGEVDRDLNVLAVNGHEEKTTALRSDIEKLLSRKQKVTIAIPTDNAEHWTTAFSDHQSANPELFNIISIQTAAQVLDHIGIALPIQNPKIPTVEPIQKVPNESRWGVGALVLLIGASAVAGGVSYSPEIKSLTQQAFVMAREIIDPQQTEKSKPVLEQEAPKSFTQTPVKKSPIPAPSPTPEKDVFAATPKRASTAAPVRIRLSKIRTQDNDTCKQTKARGTVSDPILFERQRSVFRTQIDGKGRLCRVEILARSSADNNYIFGRYQRWITGRPNTSAPSKVLDLGPRQGNVSWSVDIPNNLQRPAIFQVLILSSAKPFEVSDKIIQRLDEIRSEGSKLDKLRKRMRWSGIKLTLKRFRIVPKRNQTRNTSPEIGQQLGQRPPSPLNR